VPKKEVLESTPSDLWCYDDAYIIRTREEDKARYYMGLYNYEAFSRVLASMFSKNKTVSYLEHPMFEDVILTEDDVQKQTDLLFAQLDSMQRKFENRQSMEDCR
jgi:hypothetical protein